MHGLGNSYIYVNEYNYSFNEEELSPLAVAVSDTNTGIGSDGLILIGPSTSCDVRMRIFNKDGSEAKNCGNGLRCVARYAYEHGLVSEPSFTIETKSGPVSCRVEEHSKVISNVTVDMGNPHLLRKNIPMQGKGEERVIAEPYTLENGKDSGTLTAVSMGNPHAVFFVDDIASAPVESWGPQIEKDERFPESVNVEFVEVVSSTEVHFRVWERGSGITQACGTGACAAVVASVLNGHCKQGEPVLVHLLGGDLTITWTEEGTVLMTGPAEDICTGFYIRD
ncbi:diaminopimelate epimerase [Texcoconibacillus texcoconensis]|nr:diaminopimelate epimerase [Texcoconibacillus texcoconensis]